MKPSWSLCIAGTTICGGSLLVAALLASSYHVVTIVHASAGLLHQEVTHPASEAEASKNRKSVLVELITSDECEACQSAEKVLTHIDRDQSSLGRDVIVLSEHIKPEDLSVQRSSEYLSPTDPTRRQENYQQLGTSSQPAPIFLINGIVQSEQATSSQIEDSVRSAPANTVPLTLTAVEVRGRNVTFNLDGGPTTNGYVNVYAALVEPSAFTKWTDQQGMEHTQISSGLVYLFGRTGSSFRTSALGKEPFGLQSRDHRTNFDGMRLVVFVQTKHIGTVLGSTSCVISQNTPSVEASSITLPFVSLCPTTAK